MLLCSAEVREVSGSRVWLGVMFVLVGVGGGMRDSRSWGQGATALAARGPSVVLVMSDGLRWQEVFRGADESLLTPKNFYEDRNVDGLKQRYLAATPEERRQRLLPFFWSEIATRGQVFGDRDNGSEAAVTNGLNFSYPGYSEVLTGHPDPRVNSNDNIPNPNMTVLEWLNRQPGLEGQVAAFGAWEVIAGIVNAGRCGFPVNVAYAPFTISPMTPRLALVNEIKAGSPRIWDDESFDAPTFETAMEYVGVKKPRVLFLSLGETDDWAHAGNYGEYLESAHRVDQDLRQLWDTLQSMPEYRGQTTLIFLPDHGRGSGAEDWKSHGQKLPDSKNVFMGFLGPGVASRGVRGAGAPVFSNQVAATLAAMLGKDWDAAETQAGKAIVDVLPPASYP